MDFKGSALQPFLDPLNADERAAFLAAYLERIKAAYPRQERRRGSVVFPAPVRGRATAIERTAYPRPSNGIFVALMVMNSTFVSRGRFAMATIALPT